MSNSKFIVIDGIDGSGKATQVELLKKYFDEEGIDYLAISFPRYDQNVYGDLVRRYLLGEFGEINEVDPHLAATLYAGDRILAKKEIEKALNSGKTVIADRYVSSSKAHLSANLPEEKREEFIQWVDKLEYETNGVPREDLTFFLNVTPEVSQKLADRDDIHERDLDHLQKAHGVYLKLAQNPNWKVIECMNGDQLRTPEDISQEIISKIT